MTALDQLVTAAEQTSRERTRGCERPVRMKGTTQTVDTTTGEILQSYSSADELDGHTYIRCGDRRAWRCQSCSHEYKGDAWHLLNAGLTGDKGVTENVKAHPSLFITLTAPSFGLVHGLRKKGPCRGRRDKPTCPHGRPQWCHRSHRPDDDCLGEPLCRECYDYRAHVAWQWSSPELWRRTRIALDRQGAGLLRVPRSKARDLFRLSYAKVAEFQARGVIHFHVILRVDGPTGPDSPPPGHLTPELLEDAVRSAVETTTLEVPTSETEGVRLRWGTQLDIRPVHTAADRDGHIGPAHPEQVASYLAKYLTKSCEDFGIDRPIRNLADARGLRPHVRALIQAAHDLSHLDGHARLRDRYSTLGYRGHPITKTRAWSVTFTSLRQARKTWRERPPGLDPNATIRDLPADDDQDAEDTTVVLQDWTYAGTGYLDLPAAHEAIRSAAAAREHTERDGAQVG